MSRFLKKIAKKAAKKSLVGVYMLAGAETTKAVYKTMKETAELTQATAISTGEKMEQVASQTMKLLESPTGRIIISETTKVIVSATITSAGSL